MKITSVLGTIKPAQFFQEYWHKKPLLIRQAIPQFKSLIAPEALFALAARDDVESRLVQRKKNRWQMSAGPVDAMPPLDQRDWTLLVQGVNLHDDAVDALLQRFRFIPDARLDDLMISYATDGGGVGAHVDSYDVFLLQAYGKRRWRISMQSDLSLQPDMPLKLLKHFVPEAEYVLEPGDMLYLPPDVAHDGVALGECITYSIGFRAPSYQEMGEAFLEFMSDTIDLPGRYADPELTATAKPARIHPQMLSKIESELKKLTFTPEDIAQFTGEYLSTPKPTVFFTPPDLPLPRSKFLRRAFDRGITLSKKTRMLYQSTLIFINGESFTMTAADKPALTALADARVLEGSAIAAASEDVKDALHDWYCDGWIELR